MESDEHFYTVCRYVERNPVRAGLVERAEARMWGSAWVRAASYLPCRDNCNNCATHRFFLNRYSSEPLSDRSFHDLDSDKLLTHRSSVVVRRADRVVSTADMILTGDTPIGTSSIGRAGAWR